MSIFQINKDKYNYLLPIYGNIGFGKFLVKSNILGHEIYYFIGTNEEYKDLLNRCKYL